MDERSLTYHQAHPDGTSSPHVLVSADVPVFDHRGEVVARRKMVGLLHDAPNRALRRKAERGGRSITKKSLSSASRASQADFDRKQAEVNKFMDVMKKRNMVAVRPEDV